MRRLTALALVLLAAPADAAELVLFEFDGCLWCEEWKGDVGQYYAETAEGKMAPLRLHDIADKRPADLAAIRPIRATPTFVLVDEGKEIGRIVGYRDEKTFWAQFGEMLKQ